MSSDLRQKTKVILVALFCLSLLACGLKVGDKKKEDQLIKLDDNTFMCVSHITEYVEAYIEAKLNSREIVSFYDCLKRSFSEFQKYTRGSSDGAYSSEEIKYFLEKNFLKPKEISHELLSHVMNLKVALLGGKNSLITQSELKKFNLILDGLKNVSLQIQPYMKILNSQVGLSSYSYRERLVKVNEAEKVVRKMAQLLGRVLRDQAHPYRLEHAKDFLVELSKIFYSESKSTVLKARQWGDLMTTFKPIAVGGSQTDLEPNKWGDFLQVSLGWYIIFLRYKYQTSGGSLLYGPGFKDFVDNVENGFHLTEMSLGYQEEGVVTYEHLEQLVYRMKALNLMPRQFSAFAVSKTLRPLFDRILGNIELKPADRRNKGLTKYALAQGVGEFYRWSSFQFFLNHQFNPSLRARTEELSKEFFSMPVLYRKYEFKKKDPQVHIGIALKEMDQILAHIRPFFQERTNKTFLTPREELSGYNVYHGFYNLSVMNIMRGLTRLLIRGYAEDLSRSIGMEGVTMAEIGNFFKDMIYLGKDLEYMDPRNLEVIGWRIFTAGNVFTFTGNGIWDNPSIEDPKRHLLVFEEIVELLSLNYSGSSLGGELFQLGKKNCSRGPLDIFGYMKVNRVCLRDQILHEFSSFLTHMPEMKNFWEQLEEEDKRQFYINLENIVVRPVQDQTHYKKIMNNILSTTEPMRRCDKPWFSSFHMEAREKWEACVDSNRTRFAFLNKAIEQLRKKGVNTVDCGWTKQKEVSEEYCEWIELGELEILASFLQYVEVIMVRHDVNRNGTLDGNEVWSLFEVFRGLVDKLAQSMGKKLSELNLKKVYAYLLKNEGAIPRTWNIVLSNYSDFEIDRLDLIKVFGTLLGKSSKPPSPVKEKRKFAPSPVKEKQKFAPSPVKEKPELVDVLSMSSEKKRKFARLAL